MQVISVNSFLLSTICIKYTFKVCVRMEKEHGGIRNMKNTYNPESIE